MPASLGTTSRTKRGNSESAALTNKKVTNANTDRLCLDDNSSFLGRLWYHLSLHNGLYLLDPTEKAAFNTAGALFTVLTILYLWSFGRGFVDGLAGGASGSSAAVLPSLVHQPPPALQQGAVGLLLDPTGSGGGGGRIRNNNDQVLLSAALGDAAAAAAANGRAAEASVGSSVLASASATGGAANEL
jgi:hypothetical protein